MKLDEQNYLAHYGILRKSGRYPWGSGDTQNQRNKSFLDTIDGLRKQGMTDTEICRGFSTDDVPFTTTNLRALTSIARAEQKQSQINEAQRLQDKGLSNVAIGQRMGLNESSVRALLAPGAADKSDQLKSIADMLKRQVEEKEFVDVGVGVERSLPLDDNNPGAQIGVASTRFKVALAMLEEEGYGVHTVKIPQAGTNEMTTIRVLVKKGVSQREAWDNRANIKLLSEHSDTQGRPEGWEPLRPPTSMDSKRIGIRYGDEGGSAKDGVIEIRPGAKGLDMGSASYAQVRIAVDGSHYLKGMAVYNDKLPPGVDLVFNTNKSKTGSKLDVMKPLNRTKEGNVDWDNPFGALPKAGGQRGHLNILREEGDWDKWSKSLPSQMLSKQSPDLIKHQLERTYEGRRREYEEISSLTNPAVKKELLRSFSDGADSAAVHLAAAALPHQATKVLLPIPSLKENEVVAPSFENGTRLALVRFPHGGTFEIPDVVVNNKNREARAIMGHAAVDAIGIHPKVAERLSGADFDGDHVIAIPNNRGSVKSTPALEGLKGFDPKRAYPPYDGMKTVDGGTYNAKTKTVEYSDKGPRPASMQHQMGDISNLITDMTIQGANTSELARAVRHSMVVIDSEKHALDFKESAKANGIKALKVKYQGRTTATGKVVPGGASTLISKAGGEVRLPDRRKRRASEGGFIDPATGKKVYVDTGKTHVDRATGETVPTYRKHERLSVTEDAHQLSSGTTQEELYADHSNKLKALANDARKQMVSIKPSPVNASAKVTYSKEVESLKSKLNVALKNAPLERQAQVLTKSVLDTVKRDNPGMDADDLKKLKFRTLAEMRVRTGAVKQRIELTQEEWNAIQAGAISTNLQEKIFTHGNTEQIRKLATPRTQKLMTPTATARAKAMLASGYTQAEVAAQLGVSLTTLKEGIQ